VVSYEVVSYEVVSYEVVSYEVVSYEGEMSDKSIICPQYMTIYYKTRFKVLDTKGR